jgi:hypothetical protein
MLKYTPNEWRRCESFSRSIMYSCLRFCLYFLLFFFQQVQNHTRNEWRRLQNHTRKGCWRLQNHTRSEWRDYKTTLETSGEDCPQFRFVFSQAGGALRFDGLNDLVSIIPEFKLDYFTQDFSWEMWWNYTRNEWRRCEEHSKRVEKMYELHSRWVERFYPHQGYFWWHHCYRKRTLALFNYIRFNTTISFHSFVVVQYDCKFP